MLLQARRRRATLAVLGLRPPPLRHALSFAAAAALGSGLLVAAAAQPALVHARAQTVRTDAQAFVVVDTSRSMSASATPSAPTRLERARRFATAFRAALPEIPVGVASFTDRALPHLLPTGDAAVFDATIRQAVAIDRPPPLRRDPLATSYPLLQQLPEQGSFSPHVRRRLLVLLTDGESQPYSPGGVVRALALAHTGLLVARFWRPTERVFVRGADAGYRPQPASTGPLTELGAAAVGGRVFGTATVAAAAAAARRWLGAGPTTTTGTRRTTAPLAPWLTLTALLPLGYVLLRRGGARRAEARRRARKPALTPS